MDVSLIYELSAPSTHDQDAVRRTYWEAIEQIQLADRLGYRTAWFTEHHFLPGLAHSSAPEEMLAYLAARTENIRLGHAVVLLPHAINHPARVAERIAVLDVLSNGRVEFGGGRAITAAELLAFGVDPDESREQMEEALRMLPEMWTSDKFSWNGPTITIPERHITPKPVQQPHPPMWAAATQPATVEFAGRNGLGALSFGVGYAGVEEFVRIYRKGIEEAKPIGKFINNRFGIWLHCLCAPTTEEAVAIQGANYMRYIAEVSELFAPWAQGKPPKSYEYFIDLWKQAATYMETASLEDIVAAGSAAIGDPSTVAEVLLHLEEAGVDEVLLYMQCYETPHEKIMESIELIAHEVMPKLRKA